MRIANIRNEQLRIIFATIDLANKYSQILFAAQKLANIYSQRIFVRIIFAFTNIRPTPIGFYFPFS